MDFNKEDIYSEPSDFANRYRVKQYEQLKGFIGCLRRKADVKRQEYFKPGFSSIEEYEDTIKAYRKDFGKILGWPLYGFTDELEGPTAEIEFVAKDNLGSIFRLEIDVYPNLTAYGLLFIPQGEGPFPLVIAQHGGAGTPELCAGFFGESNYNNMIRRILRRGCAVFAPQLHLWAPEYGPEKNRAQFDIQLKQLGSSITALEIFKIMRCIDYLQSRRDIDREKIGMIGLSYGGFYTLFTAAVDVRIKAALTSCYFNNRFVYDWQDWTWFNSGNTFLDAEVCALVCPRPLYIEVGIADELFDVKHARKEYEKVKEIYDKLKISHRLKYKEFQGTHELDRDDTGIEFLCMNIRTV